MSQCRSVQHMPFLDRIQLWNNDPVACAIYVNLLVILNILKDSRLSSFVVVDYIKRVEFQQRSSPHVDVLLWLDV
ncbi:hypothetical protein HPB49_017441 [Dermacentor silvarum]|uniref:Uncharacterized protein n=1 Tax=Dermacentor silvarum TaxID=543639 RepID=A0ACB8CGB1_DERSI|nr:hypothetical protein HPB49_017441 [Dermacentor silvarum]